MDEDNVDVGASVQDIRRLVELVAENGLSELRVEQNGLSITIKGGAPVAHAPVAIAAPARPVAESQPNLPAKPASAAPVSRKALEAPMVGVYYRAATPEDPPYINVGDTVRVGQVIGLIEAMKVYSEIPAEAAGRVTAIAAENGELVQQGQPLYYLE